MWGRACGVKSKHFTYLQGITLLKLGETETRRGQEIRISEDQDIRELT